MKRELAKVSQTTAILVEINENKVGPSVRALVEVTAEEILTEARKKSWLWILVPLHAKEKQKASGWTGINISFRNEVQVAQDVIGYNFASKTSDVNELRYWYGESDIVWSYTGLQI